MAESDGIKFVSSRGVYPYLPIATNAPWLIFGGKNKMAKKKKFGVVEKKNK